jgi:fluoroacetyl-CoA thioesterase
MAISPGLRASFEHTVTEADTAAAVGSGDLAVLATPRVLALAERATVRAVAGALGPEATTVGARVELEHLQASPVGAALRVEAVLERVAGRRLEFSFRLLDAERLAARGWVTRVVVDRAGFLRGAAATRAGPQSPEVDLG